MITAEEFVLEIEPQEESKNFKLATVIELFENDTAKIKFDGEDAPSEKQYAYLDSYVPEINDRVLLGVLGGTYVILGKVNYNVSPAAEEEIDRYLFDLKKVIMQKGLNVTLGIEADTLTVNNGATIVGNVGVNGSVAATGLSATGQVSAGSINTIGALGAGSTTLSSLSVSGNATVSNTLNVNSYFNHNGSSLKFFGKSSYASRQSVSNLTSSADLTTVINRFNSLLDALKMYGLIG